jgi:hypothetical protein
MEESGLFELIKTLSQSEKRYFKKYATAHGSKNPYAVALFDALEKPKEYDDALFKKNNAKQPFFSNLASEKQHLMRVLLRSLREYHRDNNSRSAIHLHLDCFELLFEKRQYKLAEKNLIKAEKLSRKYFHTEYVPSIYRAYGKLYQHSGKLEKLLTMLGSLEKEKELLAGRLKNELEYIFLEYSSYHTSRQVGYPRTKKQRAAYDNIYRSLNKIPNKQNNLKEQLNELLIANYYYDTFPDKLPLLHARKQWVDLAEQNPDFLEDNSLNYLVSLNNLANSYDELGMKQQLDATLQKIVHYPTNNLDTEVRTFIYYYNLKLVGHILSGNFADCIKLIPDAEAGMHKLWRWFHPEYKLSFRYLFSYGYFGAQKYQQSLKWINEILVNYPQETLEEYYNFARLFILIIYYELGYEGLLASELRSASRYFNKKDKLFSLEKIILSFMRSSLKPEGILATRQEIQQLHQAINKLKDDPFEKQLFSLFAWDAWSESKVTKRSFEKVIQEQKK